MTDDELVAKGWRRSGDGFWSHPMVTHLEDGLYDEEARSIQAYADAARRAALLEAAEVCRDLFDKTRNQAARACERRIRALAEEEEEADAE